MLFRSHDYKEETIAPTCTEQGYTAHRCVTCDDVYFDNYTNMLGHKFDKFITEPTCLEGGYCTYVCFTCGSDYIADYTEPNGHAYTETVNEATCVAYGYTDHVCDDCGDRFVTDYVSPKGHNYLHIVVPATKDTLGYTRHICAECNYSYLSDYVTSGDDGYIVPPEEPVIPEIHQHDYKLHIQDNAEEMHLIAMRVCDCGDTKNGYFTVTLTGEDGVITESKVAGNKIDYSALYGKVSVTLTDEEGTALKTVSVTAQEKPAEPENPDVPDEPNQPEQPEQPTEPMPPDNPNEPDVPEEPTTPNEPDTPDEPTTDAENDKGKGAAIALFVILVVLALGGVAAFIFVKKLKNKKNGGK